MLHEWALSLRHWVCRRRLRRISARVTYLATVRRRLREPGS